ncbi:MAG: ABC transporter ATP-binding protein [Anaerolineaceae bacterium]
MNLPLETLLKVNQISVTFTDGREELEALQDVSFSLGKNEFLSLLGPSGSGKSTLIRIIAGLISPSEGMIQFTNEQAQPRIGLVFQQANLMPWRTVLQNILLPLEITGVDPKHAKEKALELIALVGLEQFVHAWPDELSGGMAQRVAIARALIQDPDLLLLDEPFGSLDALTRERMEMELLRIWQASQKAVILVTHSISESIILSDRVLVLSSRPGRVTMDLPITLPRPRMEEIRYSTEFIRLERILRNSLME